MTKNDIQSKFESVGANSQYVRVSDTHPLELYLGRSENGLLTLRYNGDFVPIKLAGSNVLQVKQVKTSTYNSLLFCYSPQCNTSLFYSFCEDLITRTESASISNGYLEIVNRYNQWRKMFYEKKELLTEREVQGLIGELLFLKTKALPIFGTAEGLNGWSGPEPTHKDFSYGTEWYEIKTIDVARKVVSISSLEQLDSDTTGHLVVYALEKMSISFEGLSLNSLVSEILSSLVVENERDLFIEKLAQAGYSSNEYYDSLVYSLVRKDSYTVTADFPTIRRSELSPAIGKVKYEIYLDEIENFKET